VKPVIRVGPTISVNTVPPNPTFNDLVGPFTLKT